MGVREDGQKVLLSLEIASSESTASWTSMVEGLSNRGLQAPAVVIMDGNQGLLNAVKSQWPTSLPQRCIKHKLENLLSKAPQHCHAELKRDYSAITHADDADGAHKAYDTFVRKWQRISAEVVRCLQEAGTDLLTFTHFPRSMWKSLRTTNQLERLNGEFRRRTKTQGSFANETAALVVLYGLCAMGMIQMRRVDGWQQLPMALENLKSAA